jgi:hypothetical protein
MKLYRVGARVKIRRDSEFYYQAPGRIGKVTKLMDDGWVQVEFSKTSKLPFYDNIYRVWMDLNPVPVRKKKLYSKPCYKCRYLNAQSEHCTECRYSPNYRVKSVKK